MIFNESTGLYLYSSLIQANAALIAVLVFFLSFKLEKLNSIIGQVKLQIPTAWSLGYRDKLMYDFEIADINGKKTILENLEIDHEKSNKSAPNSKTMEYYRNWFIYASEMVNLQSSIYKPLLLLLSSIILCSIFLIFSYSFHKILNSYELICFIAILIYESFILKNILSLASNALVGKIVK